MAEEAGGVQPVDPVQEAEALAQEQGDAEPKHERKKSAKKMARAEARAEGKAVQAAPGTAVRLAQIVNLHIAGYSLSDIAQATGQTEADIDRMLQQDMQRYVRSQPALRTYVRNWVSSKYTELLDADWEKAVGKDAQGQPLMVAGLNGAQVLAGPSLEHQDRAIRILDSMRKLHGADAPVQSEVKVEAAPEAVEKLVHALARQQGLAYDVDIFDGADDEGIVDAELVHEAVEQAAEAVAVSGTAVEESDGDDELN